jgi:hypothetical protein
VKLFSEFDHALIYPPDHPLGMIVPLGGSDCAKCKYVRNKNLDCDNDYFVNWNGSHKLPAPADEYCCDFFESKPKFRKNE